MFCPPKDGWTRIQGQTNISSATAADNQSAHSQSLQKTRRTTHPGCPPTPAQKLHIADRNFARHLQEQNIYFFESQQGTRRLFVCSHFAWLCGSQYASLGKNKQNEQVKIYTRRDTCTASSQSFCVLCSKPAQVNGHDSSSDLQRNATGSASFASLQRCFHSEVTFLHYARCVCILDVHEAVTSHAPRGKSTRLVKSSTRHAQQRTVTIWGPGYHQLRHLYHQNRNVIDKSNSRLTRAPPIRSRLCCDILMHDNPIGSRVWLEWGSQGPILKVPRNTKTNRAAWLWAKTGIWFVLFSISGDGARRFGWRICGPTSP